MPEHVLIHDPSVDADRKFEVKAATKSVVERINELQTELQSMALGLLDGLDIPEDGLPTTRAQLDDQVELRRRQNALTPKAVRNACDQINTLCAPLEAGDTTLEAGNMLFSQWESDKVTEGEIDRILEDADKKSTARPR